MLHNIMEMEHRTGKERLEEALKDHDKIQIFQVNRLYHPFLLAPSINFGVVASFQSVPDNIMDIAKEELRKREERFTPHVEHWGTIIMEKNHHPIDPSKLH